ncbi:hypothetical protein AKUA1202_04920 [Apilactobacillus kunkeei]|uniref:Uncharacterized protein n=1 Tax=Apilactobacillus kunkeei TaxID=148814 RepID=A0A1L8CFV7_9LACO|nr:hypothetical protein [Apilactobacillus kunkeei]CAI2580628.1 hypothetical protein AKUA1802_04810 [Apilactobacillus kunkeei]CAI2581332.1 hypothetical protein AKUA0901_04810 [Apilactobacillus kunkeei]CAI2581703.1 hypothetical protein AKUA1201_04810 [Apilactobacillus kunkeei]CAI2581950.1 hypothetical protein AKUA1002_04810 [Apilactobacillus kunkeei]CAI2614820.1 hypothetical protein AKUH3B103M_09240 [Apilactobacillus kunkeei]
MLSGKIIINLNVDDLKQIKEASNILKPLMEDFEIELNVNASIPYQQQQEKICKY